MSISVPSRFACLIVDDEVEHQKIKAPNKQKMDSKKEGNKDVKSKKANHNQGTNCGIKKERKVKQLQQKQWEEWKEKDSKLVDGHYEKDLEVAIIQSKLDFEHDKEKHVNQQTDSDKKINGKKKKKNIMSLNEFLNNDNKINEKEEPPSKDTKDNFFEKIKSEAKKQVTKDQIVEQRKQREAEIEEIITTAQFREKLEIERKRNKELELELEMAKEEINDVKLRNQTLYNILSTGEMKDKADVLLDLERLTIVKNDLTDEVARIHGLLEQERSKVAALLGDKHKEKQKNKKH